MSPTSRHDDPAMFMVSVNQRLLIVRQESEWKRKLEIRNWSHPDDMCNSRRSACPRRDGPAPRTGAKRTDRASPRGSSGRRTHHLPSTVRPLTAWVPTGHAATRPAGVPPRTAGGRPPRARRPGPRGAAVTEMWPDVRYRRRQALRRTNMDVPISLHQANQLHLRRVSPQRGSCSPACTDHAQRGSRPPPSCSGSSPYRCPPPVTAAPSPSSARGTATPPWPCPARTASPRRRPRRPLRHHRRPRRPLRHRRRPHHPRRPPRHRRRPHRHRRHLRPRHLRHRCANRNRNRNLRRHPSSHRRRRHRPPRHPPPARRPPAPVRSRSPRTANRPARPGTPGPRWSP